MKNWKFRKNKLEEKSWKWWKNEILQNMTQNSKLTKLENWRKLKRIKIEENWKLRKIENWRKLLIIINYYYLLYFLEKNCKLTKLIIVLRNLISKLIIT